jgi:hypothetical protein
MTRAHSSESKLESLIERRPTTRWRKSPEPAPSGAATDLAPDYMEPVQAWRLWEVEYLGAAPRLRSLYRICFWPVGSPFEARCEAHRLRLPRRPRHAAPTATCSCGIYAVPFELIRKRLALHDGLPRGRSLVIGTVSLWGDVLECQRGWRAAFAYPSRLFLPRDATGAKDRAAGLLDYGVPIELLDTRGVADALDDMAELAACGVPVSPTRRMA